MLRSARTSIARSTRQAVLPLRVTTATSRTISYKSCRSICQGVQQSDTLSRVVSTTQRGFSTYTPLRAIVPFKLHDIGEGIMEVEMLSWKVKVGQRVEHFDELCEVQSDKSTSHLPPWVIIAESGGSSGLANRADESLRAELTSPTPGVVHKLNVEEGQIVRVGSTLCEIRTDDEGGEAVEEESPVVQEPEEEVHEVQQRKEEPVPEPQSSRAEPEESVKRQQQPSPSPTPSARHNVEETRLNDDSSQYSTGVSFSGEASILPSAAPAPRAATFAGPVPERREGEFNERRKVILSSPAVRNLAGRLGVNLQDVVGSGPNGRITKDDITASSQSSGARSTPLPTMSAPRVTGDRAKMPESTRVEFGRIRKMMWKALSPQGSVPHFGYSHTLDLTPLIPYLKALNPPQVAPSQPPYIAGDIPPHLSQDPQPLDAAQKTTLLTFLVKSMLLAMEENPIMRAKVVTKDQDRHLEIRRDGVIGIAVSAPKVGLLTPSLPPLPPSTPLSSITSHLSAVRASPTAMGQSPSLIISSVGGLGESIGAMPILPPNGALAICAVGRAKWEIEWTMRDGGMKLDPGMVEKAGARAVLRCPVGWSADHRLLEGAELIAFTESWKKWIEQPWRWLKIDG